jgi:hypothetical protein
MDFMREIDAKHSNKKRNFKEPMKNPVAFSFSVVAYTDSARDIVVRKIRTKQ